MSMHIDGKKITAMYWAGQKIREAWYEGERVFSGSKPVEVMPPTPDYLDSRDWLRAKLTEYGEGYETVEEIPFEIDSSQATVMSSMFDGCSSLVTVPPMDTSQVMSMSGMFDSCSSLVTVPPMDTSQVMSMEYMFYGCSSLTDGNVRLIGRSQYVGTFDMITGSGLTREPFYDSSGQPI